MRIDFSYEAEFAPRVAGVDLSRTYRTSLRIELSGEEVATLNVGEFIDARCSHTAAIADHEDDPTRTSVELDPEDVGERLQDVVDPQRAFDERRKK